MSSKTALVQSGSSEMPGRDQAVQQGSVIVITEGARAVAFFVIEQMSPADEP
jgi:hypothetical protein